MILIKLFILTFTILAFSPLISYGAVNLPWSTTYNCADWTWNGGGDPICDGLIRGGDWTCNNGNGTVGREQITASANYSNGAGGRGQRHWLGDGANNVSGGMSISFTSTQSELWIRWYMRYENGFQWNPLNNQKILIVNNLAQNRTIIEYAWSDQIAIAVSQYSGYYNATGSGWNTIMANGGTGANGNKTSDGQWHLYEVHIKTDTNGSNGMAEMWIDGVQRLSYSNAYFGSAGFNDILIGSNSRDPLNGRCMAVDYDDIVVSTTGPIGGSISTSTPPVSDTTSPSIPSNLSAAAVSSSQISLSWTASTDNIGVVGYRIYRCSGAGCTPTVQTATSTTNSYSNTGLTASTSYTYRVSAYDAAGNVSNQSTSASATTQAVADTTPPTAPRNLTVM